MEQPSKSFCGLVVRQKARALACSAYRLPDSSPTPERYGLSSQLRRAAGSIGANIVEGYRKRTGPDELRFYNTAQVSADECPYHLILAHDLGLADTLGLPAGVEEVGRILQGYIDGFGRNS